MTQNRRYIDFDGTTYFLIQPVEYWSNHVLPDIRFLNMKFGWTEYNGNVIAHRFFELYVPIRISITISISIKFYRDKI